MRTCLILIVLTCAARADNRWDYAWTTHTKNGATKMRETTLFKNAQDTHTWIASAERDGEWVAVTPEMTNRRVPPK